MTAQYIANPMWISMRAAWLVTAVLPLLFLIQGQWIIAVGMYFVIFVPLSMFCDWIEEDTVNREREQ